MKPSDTVNSFTSIFYMHLNSGEYSWSMKWTLCKTNSNFCYKFSQNVLKNVPELSRTEDLRASSNSFSLLVAIAASSVFLWRTWDKNFIQVKRRIKIPSSSSQSFSDVSISKSMEFSFNFQLPCIIGLQVICTNKKMEQKDHTEVCILYLAS